MKIIVKKKIGGTSHYMALPDHAFWYARSALYTLEKPPMPDKYSDVWDLGCNIGVYAIQAAFKLHCRVTAFDISPINIAMTQMTAVEHNVSNKVEAICCPIETDDWRMWTPTISGRLDEKRQGSSKLPLRFTEAAERYGIPNFIKMDIEGGEASFLCSEEFKNWVDCNSITVYFECHGNTSKSMWPKAINLFGNHYLYRN